MRLDLVSLAAKQVRKVVVEEVGVALSDASHNIPMKIDFLFNTHRHSSLLWPLESCNTIFSIAFPILSALSAPSPKRTDFLP